MSSKKTVKTVKKTIKNASLEIVANNYMYYLRNYPEAKKHMHIPNSIFLISHLSCIADTNDREKWTGFLKDYFGRCADTQFEESPMEFAESCFEHAICENTPDNIKLITTGYNASFERISELVNYLKDLN